MGRYRIFIAAAFRERDRAATAATLLNQLGGHDVKSSWHSGRPIAESDADVTDRVVRQAICNQNRVDLRASDVFVLLASPHCQGSLVEFGDAYSAGKRMYVVGKPLGLTLMLDRKDVRFLDTIEDVVTALAGA